jgi:hypothetical protein
VTSDWERTYSRYLFPLGALSFPRTRESVAYVPRFLRTFPQNAVVRGAVTACAGVTSAPRETGGKPTLVLRHLSLVTCHFSASRFTSFRHSSLSSRPTLHASRLSVTRHCLPPHASRFTSFCHSSLSSASRFTPHVSPLRGKKKHLAPCRWLHKFLSLNVPPKHN